MENLPAPQQAKQTGKVKESGGEKRGGDSKKKENKKKRNSRLPNRATSSTPKYHSSSSGTGALSTTSSPHIAIMLIWILAPRISHVVPPLSPSSPLLFPPCPHTTLPPPLPHLSEIAAAPPSNPYLHNPSSSRFRRKLMCCCAPTAQFRYPSSYPSASSWSNSSMGVPFKEVLYGAGRGSQLYPWG